VTKSLGAPRSKYKMARREIVLKKRFGTSCFGIWHGAYERDENFISPKKNMTEDIYIYYALFNQDVNSLNCVKAIDVMMYELERLLKKAITG
jgi:hypothetical protein